MFFGVCVKEMYPRDVSFMHQKHMFNIRKTLIIFFFLLFHVYFPNIQTFDTLKLNLYYLSSSSWGFELYMVDVCLSYWHWVVT